MFEFSNQHDWQCNSAVQQILVFPHLEAKKSFEIEMHRRKGLAIEKNTSLDDISDSDAGAIYKLRAVKTADNKWMSLIRCGKTGKLLWEYSIKHESAKSALQFCIDYLCINIKTSRRKALKLLGD